MTKEIKTIQESDLSKVQKNLLNADQLNFLLSSTPKAAIYQRPGKGGGTWNYVTGTYVKKVLNLMFGWDWSFEIVEHEVSIEFKQVVVKGRLTVHSGGRDIVKMQFGRQDIKFRRDNKDTPLDIGNDLKGATTDALKKCASELGIASDVYAPQEYKEVQIDPDDMNYQMMDRAITLLSTSTYDGDAEKMLRAKIANASITELEVVINDLHNNQVDPIESGMNYQQSDIKEKVS